VKPGDILLFGPEITALENVMLPALIKGSRPRTAAAGKTAKGQRV